MEESRKYLQHVDGSFEKACDRMGLKINGGMSKVLMVKKDYMSCERTRMSEEQTEEV